jgi:hypothetical protein
MLVKKDNEAEKDSEGYVDKVKTLLEKYGLTKICPSTCYNWLCQLGFQYRSQKMATLWMGMKSLPQLPTGLLSFPAFSKSGESMPVKRSGNDEISSCLSRRARQYICAYHALHE